MDKKEGDAQHQRRRQQMGAQGTTSEEGGSKMDGKQQHQEKEDEEEVMPKDEEKRKPKHTESPTRTADHSVARAPFATATISNNSNVFSTVQLSSNRRRTEKHRQLTIGRNALRALTITQNSLEATFTRHSLLLRQLGIAALLIGWHLFLSMAAVHSLQRSSSLLILTAIGWAIFIYYRLMAQPLRSMVVPIRRIFEQLWGRILFKRLFFLVVFAAIVTFLVIDTAKARHRLLGLFGMAFYFVCMILCSNSPSQIVWRPVLWGFFLQFAMGLAVLRWNWGSDQFDSLSELVLTFLEFTHNGTDFVYGFLSSPPKICGMGPVFAFQTAQIVIYFGAVVALLYHFGIMQLVIKKMAWLVQVTLNTTATESLNACACIFLAMLMPALTWVDDGISPSLPPFPRPKGPKIK